MADWTAPFHRPHMRTAEFDELKRKYIKKYGYAVTIPGPEDIFHFGTERPMTLTEQANWKAKNWKAFSKDRYAEIKYMKNRRKDRFLAMLGSPSPKILNARTAIITTIDDAQDALATLSAIGTLMYMAGTAGVRKIIRGPLGWIMGAADALNFANKALLPEVRMLGNKKLTEVATKKNLKSCKAKLNIKRKMEVYKARDWEMHRLKRIQREMSGFRKGAWRGKVIEALQVTDNVYGKGISLGAIMNLPYDAAIGAAKAQTGERVRVKWPTIDSGHWGRVARRLVRNWLAFEGIPEYYRKEEHHSPVVMTKHAGGISTIFNDTELAKMKVALFLAQQTIHMTADQIDPLDMDLSVSEIQLKAPEPTNILTLEVIKEAGDRPQDGCTWPATGEKWSNARDLIEESSKHIIDNMNSYSRRNAHSMTGWAVAKHSTEAALYSLENLAGTGTVQIEHNPSYRAINGLQWLNFCVDEDLTNGQKRIFAEYLQRCDDQNYTPNTREVIEFAQRHCGFNFVQMHA